MPAVSVAAMARRLAALLLLIVGTAAAARDKNACTFVYKVRRRHPAAPSGSEAPAGRVEAAPLRGALPSTGASDPWLRRLSHQ